MDDEARLSPDLTAVAKGAGVVFLGALAGNALRYIFQVVVARRLGAPAFGSLYLGLAVMQVMALVSDLGLGQGVIRFVSIYRGAEDRRRVKGVVLLALRTALVSGPLLGLLLFVLAPVLAARAFHQPDLAPILRVMAFVLPLSTLTMILAYTFQGLQVIKYKALVVDVIEPFLRVSLAASLLAVGLGLGGVLSAYGLAALLSLLAAVFFLRKAWPAVFDGTVRPQFETRKIFAFSWPMLFAFFLGHLIYWNDAVFLGFLKTASDVGLYGAAQRTSLLLTFFLGSLLPIFGPLVSDLLHRDRKEEVREIFKTAANWVFVLTLPLGMVLVLFARPALRLFGNSFDAAALSLQILAAGWVVHSLLGSCGTLLTMSGRSRLQLVNTLFLIALNVSLHLVLIPRYGINGAAAATAGSVILYDVLTLTESRLLLGLDPFRPDLFKPLLAAGVASAVHHLLWNVAHVDVPGLKGLALGVLVFVASYGAALIGLGIRPEDRMILGKAWQKVRSIGA